MAYFHFLIGPMSIYLAMQVFGPFPSVYTLKTQSLGYSFELGSLRGLQTCFLVRPQIAVFLALHFTPISRSVIKS